MYSPPQHIVMGEMFYQQLETQAVLFELVTVGGSMRVEDWLVKHKNSFGFWPQSLASKVWVEIKFDAFVFGFSHLCIHPVMPFQALLAYDSLIDAGREEIYVRIGGTIK